MKRRPQGRNDHLFTWESREPHLSLPFPPKEYETRLADTRRIMAAQGLDGLIVCGDPGHAGDVRWLANWRPGVGSAFLFVPASGTPVLALDDEVPSYDLCATWVRDIIPPSRGEGSLASVADSLLGLVRDCHVSHRLGIVGEVGLPTIVDRQLANDLPRLERVDASLLLNDLRAIKSDLEIDVLRVAVQQTDAAMTAAIAAVSEGTPECVVVAEAIRRMYLEGAEGPSFEPLVVAGPRTRWKHAAPTDRRIGRGEPVYIDLGARHLGYCADLSRTVVLGKPTPAQASALEFALTATESVKQAARPGIPARRLREVGDEVAAQFGLVGRAGGAGHGIGCKLREQPLLDPTNKLLLQAGMTIAIEPMYVGDLGTFVIEDDILITASGSEYLSHCSRRNWD